MIGPIIVLVVCVAAAIMLISTTGSTLSYAQLVAFAQSAGFSATDAQTAAAIALAESGGNSSAIGDESLAPSDGPSYGLWQINVGSKANPQYAGQNLTDPQTNANIAFALWQSAGGFTPWSTYTSGKYVKFLQGGSSV
jgi:hypothetical protein